jgi:hypothetical protein
MRTRHDSNTVPAVQLDSSVALYRKARKTWLCQCPGNGHQNCPHIMCQQTIQPGTDYVEYLGEAAAYQSGQRYCLACGVATWRDTWREERK